VTSATPVPATAPPTGAPPGRGAPEGTETDFAATLTDIATARTATAEGHEGAGSDHPAAKEPETTDGAQVVQPIAALVAAAGTGQTPMQDGPTVERDANAKPLAANYATPAAPAVAPPAAAATAPTDAAPATERPAPTDAAPDGGGHPRPVTARAGGEGAVAPNAPASRIAAPASGEGAVAPDAPPSRIGAPASGEGGDAAPAPRPPSLGAAPVPALVAAGAETAAAPRSGSGDLRAPSSAAGDIGPTPNAPQSAIAPVSGEGGDAVPAPRSPSLGAAPVPAPVAAGTDGAAEQDGVAFAAGRHGEAAPSAAASAATGQTAPLAAASAPAVATAPAADAPAAPAPRLPVHPDHARALLHIANHRGQAQARLTLHPAELGGVEVRLRVTTHGLVASITADRAESAQVLQQAGADLKRALEAQGVEVAGLDFGVAGDEARQRAHGRDADPTSGRGANRAADDEELSPIDPDHPTTTAPTIALGALVDVLA
jgi:Flagellar hook-length control protein FliK